MAGLIIPSRRQKAGNIVGDSLPVAPAATGAPGIEKGPAETAVAEVMTLSLSFSSASDSQDPFGRARIGERKQIKAIMGQARTNRDFTVAQDYSTNNVSVKLR